MSQTARDIAGFLPEPQSLVSTWKTFGPFGPAYCIEEVVGTLDNGDTVFRVSVPRPVGHNEVLERLYSEVLADPEAD